MSRPKADAVRISVRCGRTLHIREDVIAWRKRNKRFPVLKKKLTAALLKAGFDKESAAKWLSEPREELSGKAPKDLIKPISMQRLWLWARKNLQSRTAV